MSDKLQSMPNEHWENAAKKRIATCRKLYGVDSISQVKEIRDKAVASFKNRPNDAKKKQFEHAKQAKIEKYGDASHGKKISETKQAFSTEKNAQINERRRQTVLHDYGVDSVSKDPKIMQKIQESRLASYYEKHILASQDVIPLFSKEDFIAHPFDELEWQCKKCGKKFKAKRHNNYSQHMYLMARCLDCYPLHCRQSRSETQMFNYVRSIYDGKIMQGDRTSLAPRELDIYMPDLHIAIEYNGVAWHSFEYCTDIDYHLQKTDACEKQGIFFASYI